MTLLLWMLIYIISIIRDEEREATFPLTIYLRKWPAYA